MKQEELVLDTHHLADIRTCALVELRRSGALGQYPTRVRDVLRVSRLQVRRVEDVATADGFHAFVRRFGQSAGRYLKSALGKLLGFLDIESTVAYIQDGLHDLKRRFVSLHELGHLVLPWQRPVYAGVQDSEATLDPLVREEFEAEASAFAAEVLFQGSAFESDAHNSALRMATPLALAKKYGASLHASIRRYVKTNPRPCAVLTLDLPPAVAPSGPRFRVKSVDVSLAFRSFFGPLEWKESLGAEDNIGARLLGAGRSSLFGECQLPTPDGRMVCCIFETFCNTYSHFVLLFPRETPR